MASWITHLRIADKLLEKFTIPSPMHFIVGNIAPDSGELVKGTSDTYLPPSSVSHWRIQDRKREEWAEVFRETYLSTQQSPDATSFYLGYYVHLIVDYYWHFEIMVPTREKFATQYQTDYDTFRWDVRKDLFDLDCLYLMENSDFNAWSIFRKITEFPNAYLDYFSESAIEKRIADAIQYYENYNEVVDRELKYVTQNNADKIIDYTTKEIIAKLESTFFRL